jgi:hypothetical protein
MSLGFIYWRSCGLEVDKKEAKKRLENEWAFVLKNSTCDFLDSAKYGEQIRQITEVIHGSQLTYKYILLTAVLAKTVNRRVHYRALQQGSKLQGAYDARSLAHGVIVPFEKSHGERFGGSNEPFLNRPARYTEFDLSNRDRNREAQERLHSLLENSQVYSETDETLPISFLRQVLKEVARLEPTAKEFHIPPVQTSLRVTMRAVKDFLRVSGSGERLVAICAAVFAGMYGWTENKWKVRAYPVNWADKFARTAGDIEFYLNGKLLKAAEAKDKPISESDVSHCQMKANRHGITEYIILDGAGVVEDDEQAIGNIIESQLKEGLNLYLLKIPDQLFPYLLFLGEQGRKVFLNNVGKFLNEIKAKDENKKAWQQVIDECFLKR